LDAGKLSEPAKVIAEYRGYARSEGAPEVIVRILEYVPDALQGTTPEGRRRMRYFAEVVSAEGEVIAAGNPDQTPELALFSVHWPAPVPPPGWTDDRD